MTAPRARFENGVALSDLLLEAGLVASKGEAKRHAAAGALRVNDAVIDDAQHAVGIGDLDADGQVKLSVGKKKHAVARAT